MMNKIQKGMRIKGKCAAVAVFSIVELFLLTAVTNTFASNCGEPSGCPDFDVELPRPRGGG